MRRNRKDSQRRTAYGILYTQRQVWKALLQEKHFKRSYLLHDSKHASRVRHKNRCILTARAKSVYRFFKLSRLTFKRRASFAHLEGVTRSTW